MLDLIAVCFFREEGEIFSDISANQGVAGLNLLTYKFDVQRHSMQMKNLTYYSKILVITFVVIFLAPAYAQQTEGTDNNSTGKFPASGAAADGKINAQQHSILLNRISVQHSAKVIIQLKPNAAISINETGLSIASISAARTQGIKQRQEELISKLNLQHINKVKQFKTIPFIALDVDENSLEQLLQSDEVLSITEDRLNYPSLINSIPYISADFVWNENYTGNNQSVAILDTGIESDHSFFSDPNIGSRIIAEACYSTTYGPFNATALCDSGSTLPGAGLNCTGYTDCKHGTHVAGIAAGDGSNNSSGVAKGASLIAIQVFSGFSGSICGSSTSCLSAFTSDIILGLERVYDLAVNENYSIASANLSLGGDTYASVADCDAANQATKQAIDNLRSIGIATVIAAGNNGSASRISSPGCISSAISVGATNNVDQIASFSNSANWLTLLAPGRSITSSIPGGSFTSLSGTSMAAPHVAGAFALLKSQEPSASVDQLLAALVNTGVPVQDSRNGFIAPRIDLESASNALIAGLLPANIILDNDFDGVQTQGQFDRVVNTQSYNGSELQGVDAGSNIYRFTPIFSQSGVYRVYGWWRSSGNNTNEAVFTIKDDSGEVDVIVNQQTDGSQWYALGDFYFSTENTAYIEISDPNGAVIIADAVRLEYLQVIPLTIESNDLPSAFLGVDYNFSLIASGGTTPYTWNIIAGNLPTGLSLQSNGTISGVPSQPESSNFTVEVTDNDGNITTQALNLTIAALHIETNALSDGTASIPYNANLVASGGSLPYTWYVINGNLPTGLSLQTDGTISGVPSQAESSNFTIEVTDNAGNMASQVMNLNIASGTGDAFDFEDDFESGILSPWNQLLSGSVELVDDPNDGFVLRKVGQNDPSGGWAPLNTVLDEFELVLYTRKVNNSGGNVIRYSLTDGNGDGYGIKLSYPKGTLGIEKRTDWNGSSASGSINLPEQMTLNQWYTLRLTRQGNALNASIYLGRVDPAQAISMIEVSTTDNTYTQFSQINIQGGYEFDTDNVRISSDTAQQPALSITTSTLADGSIGTAYNISLIADGGSLPYSWNVISGNLPAGLTLSSDGTISGVPSQSETSNFSVEVTDNEGGTAAQALSLNVSALTIEANTLANGVVGAAYNTILVASNGTLPYTWNLIAGDLPAGLSLQNDGTISGIPSQAETNVFTVEVTDNTGITAEHVFSLTIIMSGGGGAVFEDDFESGILSPWNQLLSGSVELVDDPNDGFVLRKVGQNDPSGGWAPLNTVLDEFELVLYTRKVNNSGGNVIRYSLTDGNGDGYGIKLSYPKGTLGIEKRTDWNGSSASGSINLPEQMTLNQWYTLRLTRQGNALNASIYLGRVDPAQAISMIEVSTTDNTYTQFSQINIQGGYEFDTDNVRISSDTAQQPALSITTSTLADGSIGTAYNISLIADGGSLPYSWNVISGNLPAGLTLSSDGTISGVPSQSETSNFSVEVTDNEGGTAAQALSLNVSALTIEANTLANGVVGAAYNTILVASNGTLPYTWNLIAGDLPAGLSLQNDGTISGIPSQAETNVFTVEVTDNTGITAEHVFSLTIIMSGGGGAVFEDDFESGILSPWNQLLSGSVELVDDPNDGFVLRKIGKNDPNGGWAPLGAVLNDLELVLYTRKVNSAGGNVIRYSLTDSNGDGYGIILSYPKGTLIIEKRNDWLGSVISSRIDLSEGMALNQWYTLRLSRQGDTLNATVYLGKVDPAQATPEIEISTSDSTYNAFSQINIQGGYEFDTDNISVSGQ